MALDSRQKRAAVIGVARCWYRNPHPSSTDASQRAAIGQVYPVATFQEPIPPLANPFATLSYMDALGAGITSTMDADGSGITSTMTTTLSTLSIMDADGSGINSTMDDDGSGITSEI